MLHIEPRNSVGGCISLAPRTGSGSSNNAGISISAGAAAKAIAVRHPYAWASDPLKKKLSAPPTGTPSSGGAITTAGNLVFIGATIDGYFRAFETTTGRELWKADLPAGGQANPMSYVSKKTGRQYVVVAAGGHSSLKTPRGVYLVAYALPQGK